MKRCKSCGQMLGDDEKYCPSCGTKYEEEVVEEVKTESEEPSYPTKLCKKCGAKIHVDAIVCPKCGCAVEDERPIMENNDGNNTPAVQHESSTLANFALIFGILGGWLGLILSAVGLITLKDERNRKKCKIGLGFVIAWVVIFVIIGIM